MEDYINARFLCKFLICSFISFRIELFFRANPLHSSWHPFVLYILWKKNTTIRKIKKGILWIVGQTTSPNPAIHCRHWRTLTATSFEKNFMLSASDDSKDEYCSGYISHQKCSKQFIKWMLEWVQLHCGCKSTLRQELVASVKYQDIQSQSTMVREDVYLIKYCRWPFFHSRSRKDFTFTFFHFSKTDMPIKANIRAKNSLFRAYEYSSPQRGKKSWSIQGGLGGRKGLQPRAPKKNVV